MKIIRRKADNVVLFAEQGLALDADGARGDGWVARFVTTADAELVAGVQPPADFLGGCYTYAGGVWAVAPGVQAQLDAAALARLTLDQQAAIEADVRAEGLLAWVRSYATKADYVAGFKAQVTDAANPQRELEVIVRRMLWIMARRLPQS